MYCKATAARSNNFSVVYLVASYIQHNIHASFVFIKNSKQRPKFVTKARYVAILGGSRRKESSSGPTEFVQASVVRPVTVTESRHLGGFDHSV